MLVGAAIFVLILAVTVFCLAPRRARWLAMLGGELLLAGLFGVAVLAWGPEDFFVRVPVMPPWTWGWISMLLLLVGGAICLGLSAKCLATLCKRGNAP